MLVAVSIMLALTGSGPAGGSPELPAYIVAWECSGAMSPGMEWTGAKIDVRDERIRFVEIVMRFDSIELPADEARWFERPRSMPVVDFVAWEEFCRDDCRDEILRELLGEGSNPLVERASGGRSCRERVSVEVDGAKTSRVALELVAMSFRSGRSGLIVNPRVDPATVTCTDDRFAGQTPETSAWIDERHDLDRESVKRFGTADDSSTEESMAAILESAVDLQESLLGLLASRRPEAGTLLSGPAAVRLAAYEARELATLCSRPEDGPAGYPGDFALSAAVLPGNVVQWAASIEARLGRNERDSELAIRMLGDKPAPRQRDALFEILRDAIAGNDTVSASLALRALLKADPEEARRMAEPLLEHSALWRSACGVFVLSDPQLARRLEAREEITIEVRDEIQEYLASGDAP